MTTERDTLYRNEVIKLHSLGLKLCRVTHVLVREMTKLTKELVQNVNNHINNLLRKTNLFVLHIVHRAFNKLK